MKGELLSNELFPPHAIAVLPYRFKDDLPYPFFLLINEMIPVMRNLEGYLTICGKVEVGERPADCAVRELREETGLSVKQSDLICLGSTYRSKLIDQETHLFSVNLKEKEHPRDPDNTRWFSKQEIINLKFSPLCEVIMGRMTRSAGLDNI